MTKKKAKTATVKKTTERSSSCPIFQRIMSFSLEEKKETRLLKITKRRIKREAAKLRRAEDQKQAEVEENSSSTAGDDDAAEVTTITKKKQRPPQPKRPVQVLPYLHEKHSFDKDKVPANLKEPYWYTGKEVKELYQLDKVPKLAHQKKSLGGQCAFQAHSNLMKSITSIATDPKQAKFIDDTIIRQTMSNTVRDILTLMDQGKIPLNEFKSHHYYPGDVELKEFSVFAFKKMGGRLTPYRYKEMRLTGGLNCGVGWLLRQPAGYFIVYGNREATDSSKYEASFHFFAVNIEKRLIIDNKTTGTYLRLSQVAFDNRMKTVHSILRLEKMVENEWKITF